MKPSDFRTTHKRLASGRVRIYYYTRRCGTRFFQNMDHQLSAPYPEAFIAAFQQALETERETNKVPTDGEIGCFLRQYERSPDFQKLALATQQAYRRDMVKIRHKFGGAPAPREQADYLAMRKDIVDWHEEIARSSPRRADSVLTVFRNALAYATRKGLLLTNPAADLQAAYSAPDDKRPWAPQEIATFLAASPQDAADIFHVAMYTGLRRTDLVQLTWAAIGEHEVEWKTSKSRGKRTVIIPLTDQAKQFFQDLKRRQMESDLGLQRTVITGARGKSLTANALQKKINARAKDLGIYNTLHRLRNTYATLLVKAGFEDSEIAGIMGWTVDDVKELKRIYVHRDVIVADQVRRLREAGKS